MSQKQVSIATKPLVYSAFRYISNKVYNALAEYVDNSIQSFINHKDLLSKINEGGKLTVKIKFDLDNDCIVIQDNAYGISEEYYENAFELANIPLDASGLNEFGMGMKVSSIWLSNLWSVETSAYGEEYRKTLIFDLEEVVKEEKLELDVKVDPCEASIHYTTVTLNRLSQNKPSNRQLSYIKKHLASIYTKYIREGILDLIIDDELQTIEEPKVLNAPYYKTPNGVNILWKRLVSFSAPKFIDGIQVGSYKVKGFIGILEKMSTSTENGFLLFRRGRVIGSSYDDKYRPKILCGEEGSPRYKRIFGELEIEGFNVSFTKSSFTQDADFDAFIEMFKEDLDCDKAFDIFGQAQNYKKPIVVTAPKVAKNLNSKLVEAFNTIVVTTPPKEDTSDANVQKKYYSSPDDLPEHVIDAIPVANPETASIKIDDTVFELEIGHVKSVDKSWFYTLEKVSKDPASPKYKTQFNLSNPFFERFGDIFSSSDGYLPVATFIKTMVATEIILLNGGDMSGAMFREKFNRLFGQI